MQQAAPNAPAPIVNPLDLAIFNFAAANRDYLEAAVASQDVAAAVRREQRGNQHQRFGAIQMRFRPNNARNRPPQRNPHANEDPNAATVRRFLSAVRNGNNSEDMTIINGRERVGRIEDNVISYGIVYRTSGRAIHHKQCGPIQSQVTLIAQMGEADVNMIGHIDVPIWKAGVLIYKIAHRLMEARMIMNVPRISIIPNPEEGQDFEAAEDFNFQVGMVWPFRKMIRAVQTAPPERMSKEVIMQIVRRLIPVEFEEVKFDPQSATALCLLEYSPAADFYVNSFTQEELLNGRRNGGGCIAVSLNVCKGNLWTEQKRSKTNNLFPLFKISSWKTRLNLLPESGLPLLSQKASWTPDEVIVVAGNLSPPANLLKHSGKLSQKLNSNCNYLQKLRSGNKEESSVIIIEAKEIKNVFSAKNKNLSL